VTITLVVTLASGGANVDSAHVQSELPDSDMTNDSAPATTNVVVPSPRLKLTNLRVSPSSFRVKIGRKGGTAITYTDSAAATTTLTFMQHVRGVVVKRRCLASHSGRGSRKPARACRSA